MRVGWQSKLFAHQEVPLHLQSLNLELFFHPKTGLKYMLGLSQPTMLPLSYISAFFHKDGGP